jgi:hypothetical protein
MTTQTAERTSSRISESELVRHWRIEQLRRAGYPARAARTLATRPDVDLHLAIDLLARGCSAPLAAQILL